MSYQVQVLKGQLQRILDAKSLLALVVQDATAPVSTAFTLAAGGTQATTADNTGFFPSDVIQLPGGTAGANEWYMIQTCGVPVGADNTVRTDIRSLKTPVVAINAVAASPYYKVPVKFMPQSVKLTNQATGVVHEWSRGMLANTAIRNPGGAATVLTDSGIIALPNWVYFHPSLLSTSQTMRVEVTYPNA